MTGKLVASGVHNIWWILDKDENVIGALHGTTYFDMIDVRRSPHVSHLYHQLIKLRRKERLEKEERDGKS